MNVSATNMYGPFSSGSSPTSWGGSRAYTYSQRTSGVAYAYPRQQIYGISLFDASVTQDNVISYIDGYREVTTLDINPANSSIGSSLCMGSAGNGPGSNWR